MNSKTRAKPDIVDWNNDGKLDLVVGMEYGNVQIILNTGTLKEPEFASVQELTFKNGKPFKGGMRCDVTVCDWNGDKKKDLLTADEFGVVRYFENIGTDAKPEFQDEIQLKADGWPIRWGQKQLKQNFDFNNDGQNDSVMINNYGQIGGYKGDYVNVDGEKYACTEKRCRIAGCDWNHDGNDDILVGLDSGGVELLLNKGIEGKYEFGPPVKLAADSKEINAGPEVSTMVTDWDKDGKDDLLCIDNTGKCTFYANIGTDTQPKLTAGKEVAPTKPYKIMYGSRSRLETADFNGDGKLDLLFGPSYNWKGRLYIFLQK